MAIAVLEFRYKQKSSSAKAVLKQCYSNAIAVLQIGSAAGMAKVLGYIWKVAQMAKTGDITKDAAIDLILKRLSSYF